MSVPPDTITVWTCPECGATKGNEAQWRDGKKVLPNLATRWCGPTHEHPRRKMVPEQYVRAGVLASPQVIEAAAGKFAAILDVDDPPLLTPFQTAEIFAAAVRASLLPEGTNK